MHPWLKGIVDKDGLKQIRESVRSAEKRTSGEIVPMLVLSSTPTSHVPWILFLLLMIVFSAALPALRSLGYPTWVEEVVALLGALILTAILARSRAVRRWLTAAPDQRLSVERRAMLEFHNSHINSTSKSTGVLIFVSLLERRRAVILADKAINDRLPPETWKEILNVMIAKIGAGHFAAAMSEAVHDLGQRLEKDFPVSGRDHNELPDYLIVKD